ncbi:magnesium transporter [Trabulsiella odontotermitis]|uniref:CBS domain-containing protein n=1 Tax=Trabulsiella odontotermitis TaxID=379893 RepID=A0A0L0GPU0_9ENTR|nr:magnesium transporter [Trabulsiella odontotermitis]KNC90438.1 hypothetical protein GM31_04855 [Trabulsiella odontotermitis]
MTQLILNHPRVDDISEYMTQDFVSLRASMTIAEARQMLLSQLSDDRIPSHACVMTEEGFLHGILSVKSLLSHRDNDEFVRTLVDRKFISVTPEDDRHDFCGLYVRHPLSFFPVIRDGVIVGALGEKEIAHLVRDENTEDAQLQGASLPLEKPYMETSPWELWRKRSVWLLLLFVAEAYTGTVLQAFEEQLEAAIALAFFIPLLIGTGGNSGTQITSTIVRAMALGEASLKNLGLVLRKEVSTSLLIAITIGVAAWIRAWIMGVGVDVTIVVSLTLVAITIWSAIVSSIIPMLLQKLRIDPAVVSAPFISTFIDGTGLIIYFKIAQYTLGI